jgi:hypothetical protein
MAEDHDKGKNFRTVCFERSGSLRERLLTVWYW